MAKKKETLEERDTKLKETAKEEAEKFREVQKYINGSRVLVNGKGNTRYDASGYDVEAKNELRWVRSFISGSSFPYELCNANNKIVGYFKEENIKEG